MSAAANLAALFKPSGDQIFDNELNWQPVPIHAQPRKDDYTLACTKRCDHFDYLMLQYMNTSGYANLFTLYRPLINYLETNSGMKISALSRITDLYDTLSIERLKGKRFVLNFQNYIRFDFHFINDFQFARLGRKS